MGGGFVGEGQRGRGRKIAVEGTEGKTGNQEIDDWGQKKRLGQ